MTEHPEQTPEQPGTDLEALAPQVIAQINAGAMTLSDLLNALAPKQQSEAAPTKVPAPKPISAKQRAVIDNLDNVYGRVVPAEPRVLEPVEAEALVVEKQHLDEIKKMSEARLKDITLTVHNHLNVLVEQSLAEGQEPPLRDANGNYVTEGRVGGPGQEQEFARELRQSSASLDHDALAAAETEGLLTHEEYLSMTTQVRVVDENKIVAALKKNPGLIKAIAHATRPGKQSTAVSLRKRT